MNRQFFSALLRRRALLIVAAVVAVCVAAAAVLLWRGLSLGAPQTRAPHPVDSPSISTTPTLTPVPSLPAEAEDVIDAPASTIVAAVTGKSIAIHESPGGAVVGTLSNPQSSGAPLVFRVVAQQGSWVQVMLAQRPNGSTGWIPASAVSLSVDPYAIVLTVATNTLDLYKDGKLLHSYPVATGTGGTPTPKGRFALTELLKPTNSGYGPYAYGTTAFSDVLNSFGGGPGQIGLHGTDDTSSIGTAASHGCVRMHNDDITALAKILPLGTPFQVR